MASQELNNAIFSAITFSKRKIFCYTNLTLEKIMTHFQKSMNTFEDGTYAPVMPTRCIKSDTKQSFLTPKQKIV